MNWHNIISMGGYGIYVWPTYFATLLIFSLNVWITLSEKKRIKKIIYHLLSQSSRMSGS